MAVSAATCSAPKRGDQRRDASAAPLGSTTGRPEAPHYGLDELVCPDSWTAAFEPVEDGGSLSLMMRLGD